MAPAFSGDFFRFLINQLRERLWVKPLVVCLLSIAAAFVAKLADDTILGTFVPEIAAESIQTLLSVIASSMLVIATFAVASMVSAYASASTTATPRSFRLVVADDVSQNALSTFIGAFIFSIVALTAMKNGYFGQAGLFILFALTIIIFAVVIVTFVRWVDRIARLGRLGSTIDKVEKATAAALKRRRAAPTLQGVPLASGPGGQALFADRVGYVQYIDMAALQEWAEEARVRVAVAALPGTFAAPGRPLAYARPGSGERVPADCKPAVDCFRVGDERLFDEDPRFGLVVLSEIAGRALSPAVNDPGTAIDIVGTLVRLFTLWAGNETQGDQPEPKFDRVEVPGLSVRDMFDDAFTAISRDGAGVVEVAVRLQKALKSLASMDDADMRDAARHHGRLALKRAEEAMTLEEDLAMVREAAGFAGEQATD